MAKLKENSGKTILMALLFLLVAMMISLVLVLAAVDNARLVVNDRKYQQAALTVTSAAELLKDSLDNNSIVMTETWEYSDKSYDQLKLVNHYTEWEITGALATFLEEGMIHFETYPTDYTQQFTIDCAGFDTVYADLTLSYSEADGQGTYLLVLKLSLGRDAKVNYTVSLPATGSVSVGVKTSVFEIINGKEVGVQRQDTTVSWNGVTIKGVRHSE